MTAVNTNGSSDLSGGGLSRRKFIFISAVAAGGLAAGGCASTRPRPRLLSANDKLNIAIVGYGGKGDSDAKCCETENIMALCDADEKISPATRNRYPKAKYYQDFREMLDKEKSIDALNIATPDHLHAYIAATAMNMGKHVYVQKPLTHSVYEARLLRKLAATNKVATQMGNQGSAASGLRRAVEVIQAGLVGQVHDVHVWTNRPIWPQGLERPAGSDPVPPGMDWDLWLGPAPVRPFKGNGVYHPFNWRGRLDFGTGALGDMACHTCNLPFRALKLGYPTEIEAEAVDLTKDCYPIQSRIRFQFPAREGLAPVTFRWYDGGKRKGQSSHDGSNLPPKEVTADILTIQPNIPVSGCLILGDKGQIFSPDDYGTEFDVKLNDEKDFTPGSAHPAVKGIPQTVPRNKFISGAGGDTDRAHHQEWINACKGGQPGYSNFDIAAYLTEIMLLGCVAMRAGKKLEWDGPNMRAKNAPEALQFVHPSFRKGWQL